MFFDDDYSHIPLQPKRKAAPTPIVRRELVDKEWAEEKARVEREERDRKALTHKARVALQANELKAAIFERHLPGLTILFYMLALQPKNRQVVKEIAIAFATDQHGVTAEDIASKRKFETFVRARRDAVGMVYAARPDIPLAALGRLFGVHHTTVLHMLQALGIHQRVKPIDPEKARRQAEKRRAHREMVQQRVAVGYHSLGPLPSLTPETVIEIRRQHAAGVRQADIARWFNLDPKTVWFVVRRRTWRHLP